MRSVDGAATWGPYTWVDIIEDEYEDPNGEDPAVLLESPRLVSDGAGHWMATWQFTYDYSGNFLGPNYGAHDVRESHWGLDPPDASPLLVTSIIADSYRTYSDTVTFD